MSALSIFCPVPGCRKHALALALTLHAASACAAEGPRDLTALPLEQLLTMEVYGASKYVQAASEAPAMVTVISAADIRSYGWRTLGDVARSVRGQYVSYDRNYSYLGARGFLRPGDYNTRFLLLVDGNRINDAVYDQAPLGGEFPLDLALIERIEFVPGPGSSIYGSNAFFGVINVITKQAHDLPGTRAALEAGSAGARSAMASRSWRGKHGASLLLVASAHRTGGEDLYYADFDTPEQNHGVAEGLDYERGERLLASAASASFSFSAMHARRVKGVPTASFFQAFNDPRSKTTDRQTYLNAAWRGRAGSAEELSARLYLGRYDSFGDYAGSEPPYALNHDGSAARWWGAELSMVSTRFAGHTVLAGVDYQRNYRLHQYTFDVEPYFSYLDDSRRATRAGIYLQDDFSLSDRTRLNLGLRYDRNSGMEGVFSPRAALIYSAGQHTTIKAIYGTAFRAPNAFERFYAFPGAGGQLSHPGLAKESIRSAELALVRQLGELSRFTVTVFNNEVSGLVTQTIYQDLPETRFENAGRLRARGAEFEYERRWQTGAALRTSYSYAQVGRGGPGQEVNAPAQLAKLNLALPLGRTWRAGFEAQYVGARNTQVGSAGAYMLANATLSTRRLLPGVEASLSVHNLFDRRYADPGSAEHLQRSLAQDGRTLRARIGYAF